MAEFTRTWDCVEAPELFAGADVKRARITRSRAATFRTGKAEDDDVAADSGGGGGAIVQAIEIGVRSFAQIHCASVTKTGIGNAGFGVQRNESAIGNAEEDARLFAVGPVSDTAIDATGGARLITFHVEVRIEFPAFDAGGGVERDKFRCSGRDEHEAPDDNGSAFDSGAVAFSGIAGVIGPGELEGGYVGTIDLFEWGRAGTGFVATDGGPIGVFGKRVGSKSERKDAKKQRCGGNFDRIYMINRILKTF